MEITTKFGKGRGKQRVLRAGIEGPMTIYEAAAGKAALLETLQQASRIEIDLSGVTEMDTAGAQLLVLLKREADAAGKQIAFSAHSRAALDVLDCYQLAALLGDAVVIANGKPEGRS